MSRLIFFPYFGGKYYLLDEMLRYIDYNKTAYVELFGGSCKLLLNKYPHKVEVLNDYNGEIYNLYKVVINNVDELYEKLDSLPYSEQLFIEYKNCDVSHLSDLDRAVITFYKLASSFSGLGQSFSYSVIKNSASRYRKVVDQLKMIHHRLKKVQILNKHFKDVLELIGDNPDVFIYADPPYYGNENIYGKNLFSKSDHELLAEMLSSLSCKVMVSYYYFDGIEKLYNKSRWYYVEKDVPLYAAKNKGDNSRNRQTELLILNYNLQKESVYD